MSPHGAFSFEVQPRTLAQKRRRIRWQLLANLPRRCLSKCGWYRLRRGHFAQKTQKKQLTGQGAQSSQFCRSMLQLQGPSVCTRSLAYWKFSHRRFPGSRKEDIHRDIFCTWHSVQSCTNGNQCLDMKNGNGSAMYLFPNMQVQHQHHTKQAASAGSLQESRMLTNLVKSQLLSLTHYPNS